VIKTAREETVNPVNPRPYDLGKRRSQIDQSRQQVLNAARSLLAGTASYTAFTVDAVARQADVARATVYYQFGSKAGLLEALCDALAEAGQMSELAEAFADPDPLEALRRFVACFGRFWSSDRLAMRRLRALAALDPEVGAVISARDQLRWEGLEVLTGRLGEAHLTTEPGRAARMLVALTSFETFDALARPDQELTALTPDILRLVEAALQL
jgi:AcrR family transcriptional regulator